jgi:hypothetical protein
VLCYFKCSYVISKFCVIFVGSQSKVTNIVMWAVSLHSSCDITAKKNTSAYKFYTQKNIGLQQKLWTRSSCHAFCFRKSVARWLLRHGTELESCTLSCGRCWPFIKDGRCVHRVSWDWAGRLHKEEPAVSRSNNWARSDSVSRRVHIVEFLVT